MEDVFIACADDLVGFPEAIKTVYPRIQVQLCIVHLMRNWPKGSEAASKRHAVLETHAK